MKCIVKMWNPDTRLLVTIVVLVFLLMQTGFTPNDDIVQCLKCVRCSSLFDLNCGNGEMPAKLCSNNERYCITYEGTQTTTNVKFVVRDCSNDDEKSACRPMEMNKSTVNVCFKTCYTDGCNSAFSINNNNNHHVTLYVTSLLVLWSIYKHLLLKDT